METGVAKALFRYIENPNSRGEKKRTWDAKEHKRGEIFFSPILSTFREIKRVFGEKLFLSLLS